MIAIGLAAEPVKEMDREKLADPLLVKVLKLAIYGLEGSIAAK